MIRIEPIKKEHLGFVQRYAPNPRIGATSNVPNPFPSDGAERWYEVVSKRVREGVSQVFAISKDDDFCGIITLNDINHREKTAELDYWIAVQYQGRGIATEAASLAARLAKDHLGITTLLSSCLSKNPASSRVLEKIGFEEINGFVLESGKFKGEKVRRFKLKQHNNSLNPDAQNTRAG